MATATKEPVVQEGFADESRPVIFDSVRYPWLRVVMRGAPAKNGNGTVGLDKRIKFSNGSYATSDQAEIAVLEKKSNIFREDGTGPHTCPHCHGRLHSVAALTKHMASHIRT